VNCEDGSNEGEISKTEVFSNSPVFAKLDETRRLDERVNEFEFFNRGDASSRSELAIDSEGDK
jgi:hypothetical protein